MIKQGDYVNGQKVEMVEIVDGEPHYLIAYFDWGANKQQSLSLPEHMVRDHVTAECFESIKRTFKINHDISKLLKDSIRDSGLTLVQLEKRQVSQNPLFKGMFQAILKKYQFMQS